MYELNDTIVAVSSPTSGQMAIVRITGPGTTKICEQIFRKDTGQQKSGKSTGVVSPPISSCVMRSFASLDAKDVCREKGMAHTTIRSTEYAVRNGGLISGSVAVDDELRIDAQLYLFLAPHSYTGDDVAEIHVRTNPRVTEALIDHLLGNGLRMAGPGEFTARGYLNGKIDLAQAEAVNEIITSSNELQLASAEKLLAGRLAETIAEIRSSIIDCLSLIEAGMDFSQEDIEFITRPEASRKLAEIKEGLEQLLASSVHYESMADLAAVGIAGAPNAGKSNLLNKLLGKARSIVSEKRKTTRDVLTSELSLTHCRCVLFDCAGLIHEPSNILDELVQQAAIEALQKASVVVFCVDISKGTPFCDLSQNVNPAAWAEDITIRKLIEPKVLVLVATKSDMLPRDELSKRLSELSELFAADFITTSAKTGAGVEPLRETIDKKIIELRIGSTKSTKLPFAERSASGIALTARHKQAVIEAIENISESINELKAGNDEVTAMMLRAAYEGISNIEQRNIDEQILENIFRHFCIGK